MASIHFKNVFMVIFWCYYIWNIHTCNAQSQNNDDEFDFDGLPGVQHEFKIDVAPGKHECFYQKIAKGANLHLSFEVLRGSDRLTDVVLRKPDGIILESYYSVSEATMYQKIEEDGITFVHGVSVCTFVLNSKTDEVDVYLRDVDDEIVDTEFGKNKGKIEKHIEDEGIYTICVDNSFSKLTTKLVYVYLVTFVQEEWNKYIGEIEEMNMAVGNFTHSIDEVQKSLDLAKLHQAQSRMNVIKDWYLITGNNSYIVKWSIAQIVVIVFSSAFTVLFVRRLFNIPNVTPSHKPRA